jgi:arylsulfatase A-like enzyme
MSQLLFTALLIALPSFAASSGEGVEIPVADDRPNILLLVTDDHPHDAMSCAGNPVLQTPHMDSLASRGMRFTHAFVTTPICAASRASILTGRYERSHGYTFGQPALSDETIRETYPSLLRGAGYRVGFVGKLGVRIPAKGRADMFDSFASGTYPYFPKKKDGADTSARHLTEMNVDRAIDFIRESKAQPFCLSLSFQAPHAEDHNPDQYVWPASCDDLYIDESILPPVPSGASFVESLPEFMRGGLNRERWGWRFDTPEKHDRMVRGYYRMLSGVDKGIGRLLDLLDELELRDNTVIVLMGDNGYFLGERGFAGKWTMHDRSTRVPLIVVDPRREGGGPVDAFALNVDLAPTMLDWAGVDAPASMQGRSLRPLIDGEKQPWREEVFTEHLWDMDRIPQTEALRTDKWKYIRYLKHPEFEELYDLSVDPLEQRNLAGDAAHEVVLKGLRERCTAKAGSLE